MTISRDWLDRICSSDMSVLPPPGKIKARDYPIFSIVIPTLNQSSYIEQTIRSIILQDYSAVEIIVIDGGSTDDTQSILNRYDSYLKYWVSEKDAGQTSAINKGFLHAEGDIHAYINSDDYYLPNAFCRVADFVSENPDFDYLHGNCLPITDSHEILNVHRGEITNIQNTLNVWKYWFHQKGVVQPEVFWSRQVAEKNGPFREDLYFVMDYEYWCRGLRRNSSLRYIDADIATFRRLDDQKSADSDAAALELFKVVEEYVYSSDTQLPAFYRKYLEGNIQYSKRFWLPQLVDNENARPGSYFDTLKLIVKHPQVLLVSSFYSRFLSVILRS